MDHRWTSMVAAIVLLTAACGGVGQEPAEVSATAPGAAESPANELDELTTEELAELAAEEGEVVVYSFTSRIAAVEESFEEAYPNVDLVGFDISSTEQIERLRAEADSGNTTADVAYISDAPIVFQELVTPGLLTRYVPGDVADRVPSEHQQPLLANRLSTKVLMYNEEANPDGAPVDNLWELTGDEWRGRVVLVDPLVRGDYLDLMTELAIRSDEMAQAYEAQFGEPVELSDGVQSAGEQWIVDLLDNDARLVESTDDVNAAIGAVGQDNPPVGFSTYSDRRDNEDEGWALQIANDVEPSPGILFPALLGITADSPHPAAARLVIRFLMGDEDPDGGPGFEPFYVPGDYATRTDIEQHPDAVPLDQLRAWRMDTEATAAARDDVADLILSRQ